MSLEWDLSGRRPASERRWQSSARYAIAAPASDWCTRPAILNVTCWWTGSQCSCRSTVMTWSLRRAPVTRRAAAFCTDSRRKVVHRWCHKAVSYSSPGDTRWTPGKESWWHSWTANGLLVWAGAADCSRSETPETWAASDSSRSMTTPRSRAVSEMATRVPSTRLSRQSTLSNSWLEWSHSNCVFAAFSWSLHTLSHDLLPGYLYMLG